MELRGSGSLFGYKQSGGSGSVGYEMYTRLVQRTIYESGNLESDFYSTDIEEGEYWFSFNPNQDGNYNFSACSSDCDTEILIYNYCPIDLNNGIDYTNLPEPTHGGTFNSCSLNTNF